MPTDISDGAVRKLIEAREREFLCENAVLSERSLGRERAEEPCPVRTCFQRDRDRIIHCKSFRRLKHKTQVFLSPEGDHYRTRLTHTLEVSQIARTIARALSLNEDLTEAIALGHDIGHTPFGHAGERALTEISGIPFRHNENSLRVVTVIEKDGRGLNLTSEVRDGILCHTGDTPPSTFEGKIVALADRIAYINHDIDDAIRAGILANDEIPSGFRQVLGNNTRDRINTMVTDTIAASGPTCCGGFAVCMSSDVGAATNGLRDFLFDSVYKNPVAKGEETKAKLILNELYRYFEADLSRLPEHYRALLDGSTVPRVLCDYISGMTDRHAVDRFQEIFIPKNWDKI